jgi:hypothetical protein
MPSAFTNLFCPYGLIKQNNLFKLHLPFSSQNLNLITHLFCFICFQWLKSIRSKYVCHFCNQMLCAFTIFFCPCVLIKQTHLFNLCFPVQVKSLTPLFFFVICFQWLGSIRSKSNYHLFSQMLSALTIIFPLSILNEQNHLFKLCLPISSQKPSPITSFFCLICFQWLD